MSFLKHKAAIAGAVLSVVMSATILGSSLTYAFSDNYQSWKQYGESWSYMTLGTSGDTVKSSGCAVTAATILMVHSGSVTDEDFDPGVMIDYLNHHNGFDRYGCLNWSVLTQYAPDFRLVTSRYLNGSTQAQKAQEIENYLEEGYYVIVKIATSSGGTHFVAIDSVNGSRVTMMDPGSKSTSLFDKYSAGTVKEVRLFRGTNSETKEKTVETAPMIVETAPEEVFNAPEDAPILPTAEAPETAPPETTVQTIATTAATTTTTTIATTTTTTTAVTTTTTTTATTTTAPETMPEIVITTKAVTEPVLVTPPEEAPNVPENSNEIIDSIISQLPIENAEVADNVNVEFVCIAAPASSTDEIQQTKSIYVPEEQAQATLFKLNEQHIFMSVKFVLKSDLSLRADADENAQVLATVPAQTALNVVEVDSAFQWGKVSYNGVEGWIYLPFAEL